MALSPELITFFTAMTPFLELKLGIPLGQSLGLSTTTAYLYACAGTVMPAALALAIIDPITSFLCKRSKFCAKFFGKLFRQTRKKHSKKFNRYGALFLFTFVAIPIPGSGSMSGALIAFLFGVDRWKAFGLISLGVLASGIFVIAGLESISALLNLFT